MMGIQQRRRGASYEREVVNALRDAGFDAKRNLQYQTDHNVPDVWVEDPMLAIECKRTQRVNIHAAMAQAVAASTQTGGWPVVMTRRDNEETLCVMRLRDFVALVRQLGDMGYYEGLSESVIKRVKGGSDESH